MKLRLIAFPGHEYDFYVTEPDRGYENNVIVSSAVINNPFAVF